MPKWQEVCWWVCFIVLAIFIQELKPGLDVLVVGLIILMQEKNYRAILWLLPLFCFLQEGIGTSPFGASLMWYAAVIMAFIAGQWLFEARNFIFVFLLSACLGGVYFVTSWLMVQLQNIVFNLPDTIDKSLAQAIFMPLAWYLLSYLRPKVSDEDAEA